MQDDTTEARVPGGPLAVGGLHPLAWVFILLALADLVWFIVNAGAAQMSSLSDYAFYGLQILPAVGAVLFPAALLARHPDVAYAERSRRVHAERMPNDPLFPQQFYLGTGTATIDAVSAWDVTLGSPAIVVAVLDTGSTSHADLAGRLLPGYDFVADLTLSNDGSPLWTLQGISAALSRAKWGTSPITKNI